MAQPNAISRSSLGRSTLQSGLTLVEVVVVLVIIAILVAILVPVTSSARRSAQIQDSVQHLRQLYLNLQTYRADADGSDTTFESYYTLGLPPAQLERGPIYLQNSALLKSPCGAIRSAF